jgi:hypothetical protein
LIAPQEGGALSRGLGNVELWLLIWTAEFYAHGVVCDTFIYIIIVVVA